MISLSKLHTSVLRKLSESESQSTSQSRSHMISLLNQRGIFVASEDGTRFGFGEYHQANEAESEPQERTLETVSRDPFESTKIRTFDPYKRPRTVPVLETSSKKTDAKFDVLVTNRLFVKENLHFGKLGLTDIKKEIIESKHLLDEINQKTTELRANIDDYSNQIDVNLLDVPLSNMLGTFHDLQIEPADTVQFERPFFKCVRVDETAYVFIECLITECQGVDRLCITLPYVIRAEYVPFQIILRPNDGSGEFSGMARAYATDGNKLYMESYLFNDSDSFFINVEGNYLTRFDEKFNDTSFTWITPVKFGNAKDIAINHDMVQLVSDHPGSDIGFSDGHCVEYRSFNRVDLHLRFRFSQRTSTSIPELRFTVELPTRSDTIHGALVSGYGACYLPEHRVHTTKHPDVKVTGRTFMDIRSYIGSLLFHDVDLYAHVSYFIHNDDQLIHYFEKPFIRSDSDITHSKIQIQNLLIHNAFDTKTNEYRLFNAYNIILSSQNELGDYDQYRPAPLELTLDFLLTNRTVEVSNIELFNQFDQFDRRYLYPRSKPFHIHLRATNFVDEFDGPFDLTPDFTQYI